MALRASESLKAKPIWCGVESAPKLTQGSLARSKVARLAVVPPLQLVKWA